MMNPDVNYSLNYTRPFCWSRLKNRIKSWKTEVEKEKQDEEENITILELATVCED